MAKIKALMQEKRKAETDWLQSQLLKRRNCFDECLQEISADYPDVEPDVLAGLAETRCLEHDCVPPNWNTLCHCTTCGWVLVGPECEPGEELAGCPWCHTFGRTIKHAQEELERFNQEADARWEQMKGFVVSDFNDDDEEEVLCSL